MGLKLQNVSKKFVGKQAVENVTFELSKPGVFGLLGTNGAGKTTTIRMLLGIIKKDTGEITWNDKLVVTIFVIAKIAIKIYSNAILNYGTRLNIKDMIKMYKEKG